MSLTSASIQGFLLSLVANPQVVSPFTDSVPGSIPLNFANIEGLHVRAGTYTPNNDTITISAFTDPALAPNFILLLVDGQVNMTLQTAATNIMNVLPVSKLIAFSVLAPATNYINAIMLDGRTNVQNPMAQNVPVNYTMIYCNATIT